MGKSTSQRSPSQKVVVIGAGIGGLTAAALLAHRGYSVLVLDQAIVPGGCASTFQRRGFTFDVGATQVAGLEPGGIHHRIFTELDMPLPAAAPCDPACAVFLPGETEPINVWRDPQRWQAERQRQFPGSEPFWQLLGDLFEASWAFQARNPVLPPRSPWDVWQSLQALRPNTLLTVPHTFSTVGQVLRWYGLGGDRRLKTFLDLQLKLYSQVEAEETALLYAATALGVSQAPQGLFHLQGSMQALSDRLVESLERDGGTLLMRHTVEHIDTATQAATDSAAQAVTDSLGKPHFDQTHSDQTQVSGRHRAIAIRIRDQKTGRSWTEAADHIVANVTVQNLVQLLGDQSPVGYRQRVDKLPPSSGAFVVYLGVKQAAIPSHCPPHLQFLYDYEGAIAENNSLFVSVSHPGDGRAPADCATIVASSFTDPNQWWDADRQEPALSNPLPTSAYQTLKQHYTETAIARLSQYFDLTPDNILYQTAATPKTFAQFTGRDRGIVGGIGQRVSTFGPFGFANRTPINGLWLVGDSTHPGEGTAGVSYSALTVVRQIEAATL